MTDREFEFRVWIGRMGDAGGGARATGQRFVVQVLRAAAQAGPGGRRFRVAPGRGRSTFGRGRGAALLAGLRSPSRRVVVQVRVVRQKGASLRSAPLAAHLRYLQREGVDRDGGEGRPFDRTGEADGGAFAGRCENDRHHFRVMISPQDAGQLQDLKTTTRELMGEVENDLGTRLDWIAVDHWNTAHPHVHVLVRGKDETGADLVISRDYITRGLRARAEALVSLELGPRSAREIAGDLQRQVDAERWTGLDRALVALAGGDRLDLRPGPAAGQDELRPLLLGRLRALDRLGLASAEATGVWRLAEDLQAHLRELGLRGDIVLNLHRALGETRALAEMELFGERAAKIVIGRLAERGLFDEQAGSAYVVIDALDGRAHHVRLRDLEAAGDTPVGGVVEVASGAGGARVLHRSDAPIERQIEGAGATWLDRQLVAREPAARSPEGFGAEVSAALRLRAQHLEGLGLAERSGDGWRFAKGLLHRLREEELCRTGERLAAETGLAYRPGDDDPDVRGRYRRRLDLASGRFAMIEDGLGFRLAPWSRVIEPRLGQQVSGLMREGRIDWELGRDRGLSR